MNQWSESHLSESPALRRLTQLGWTHVSGSTIDQERDSLAHAYLPQRLLDAIKRLNPWISPDNAVQAVRRVTQVQAASLLEANAQVHQDLTTYFSLEQDLGQGRRHQTVRLIDWDDPSNNDFVVVDQFWVHGTEKIRADLVLFVNGLPLVVIEAKNPALVSHPLEEAVDQVERYQRVAPQLFWTNQLCVAIWGQGARLAPIQAPARHWAEWKDPYPWAIEDLGADALPQDPLLAGALTPAHLLDLTRNFIVFEPDGHTIIKKVARYQQWRAVTKAMDRIVHAPNNAGRGGVVWHTQGSGKSLTMVYMALKLRRTPGLQNPTILVVTDRRDLDRQIAGTFQRCGFPNPVRVESIQQLRDQLLNSGPGQTLMTTIQKFQVPKTSPTAKHPILSEESNLFVMVDEAHRTQYHGLAHNMRVALPHACFLGFTGTPIDKKDRSTPQTFGSYIDTYTIKQSVADGATVPIFYESRLPEVQVEGHSLDALFDRVFRDYREEEREAIKKRYANLNSIIRSPQRIEQVCLDLIQHYETHIQPNGFKAQIVAIDRETAVLYEETIRRLNGPESAVIISVTNDDNDRMKQYKLTADQEARIIDRFKQPLDVDPLAILIVCDKLITGFDAPVEQVLYLDDGLREHTLLQAIARVNRPAPGKTYGLVVDYYGIGGLLDEALGIFEVQDVQEIMHPLSDDLPALEQAHRTVMRIFDGIDPNDLDALVRHLEPEDRRIHFDNAFLQFAKHLDRVMPDPVAAPYLDDMRWLAKIRMGAKNRYRQETLDLSGVGAKVRQLIDDHIRSSGVTSLLAPISILDPAFHQKIMEGLPDPEARAHEMEHALRHEIRVRQKENPVAWTSLRQRLDELIQQYRQLRITLAELLQQMATMRTEAQEIVQGSQADGLSPTVSAFRSLLVEALDASGERTGTMTALAESIVEGLQGLRVIDWQVKEDVQREMQRFIRRQLRVAGVVESGTLDRLTGQLMELGRVRLL